MITMPVAWYWDEGMTLRVCLLNPQYTDEHIAMFALGSDFIISRYQKFQKLNS